MHSFNEFHEQLSELKAESIERLCGVLQSRYGLVPAIGLEYEFYLSFPPQSGAMQTALHLINSALYKAGIEALPAEEERGLYQYEVALPYGLDIAEVTAEGRKLIDVIQAAAIAEGGSADFTPKPFPDQFGSGMHVHLHLETENGESVYTRGENDQYSSALLWSIEGMLQLLPESMMLFAPYENSYDRFVQARKNAPTTLSWGPNNRTVAIRLPNKPLDRKHIEHRVAAADADPELVVIAMLAGVVHGLHKQEYPPEPVYGDAADEQYDCQLLPNFKQAVQAYENAEYLPALIGRELYSEILRRLLMPGAF